MNETSNHKNTLKTAWNDITGDTIKTGKGSHTKYADNWEGIFGKKVEEPALKPGVNILKDKLVFLKDDGTVVDMWAWHPEKECLNEIINSGETCRPRSCPRCSICKECPSGVLRNE